MTFAAEIFFSQKKEMHKHFEPLTDISVSVTEGRVGIPMVKSTYGRNLLFSKNKRNFYKNNTSATRRKKKQT